MPTYTPSWTGGEVLGAKHRHHHNDLGQEHLNVKAYGAVGDGVADDTAEIQAAVDVAQAANGPGVVYFPPGLYIITSPIIIDGTGARIIGAHGPNSEGNRPGVRIFGNFNDYLFKRENSGGAQREYLFEHIGFHNGHTTGKCVKLREVQAPSGARHCWFRGHKGIIFTDASFNAEVADCTFQKGGGVTFADSMAIGLSGHTHVSSVDINGYDYGIQAGAGANFIIGARIENCGKALNLGLTAGGELNTWGGLCAAISMEANDYGIYLHKGNGVFAGCYVLGTASGPPGGPSATGITIVDRLEGLTFIGCSTDGPFATARLDIKNSAGNGPATFIGLSLGGTGAVTVSNNNGLTFIGGSLDVPGRINAPVVATASLPAAGSQRDGSLIIEDAGAGNRNLIIYGGGERFRIDGGAAI
jgi:hypothetical protein